MNGGRTVLVLVSAVATAGAALGADPRPSSTLHRVTSHTGQFTAYAPTELLPAALCVFAERVKREWLQRLELADTWRDPIVLVVRERETSDTETPPVVVRTFRTDAHLKYQIQITTPPTISDTNLLPAVVEALCAELANRQVVLLRTQPYAAPVIPSWLRDGLAASIGGEPAMLLQAVREQRQADRWPTAAAVLSGAEETNRVASWVFIEGLLALPHGSPKLHEFLIALPAQRDAATAFWQVYRDMFPTAVALEKWWALQFLRRATAMVAQNWTATETREQLAAVLVTRVRPVQSASSAADVLELPLAELWRYADAPWLTAVLRSKQARLDLVLAQGHPMYRPVVAHYQAALGWLQGGSARRFRSAHRAAQAEQQRVEARLAAIAEHVATAEKQYVPAADFRAVFRGYFETLEELERIDLRRRTPISDYLDQFDR